jgi:hypothetical protein
MVGIKHHKVASRRRGRNCRIRIGIEEMGQSMSIVQIIGNVALTTLVRRLQTPRIGDGFKCSIDHDRRNPRQEEVCQVFILFRL